MNEEEKKDFVDKVNNGTLFSFGDEDISKAEDAFNEAVQEGSLVKVKEICETAKIRKYRLIEAFFNSAKRGHDTIAFYLVEEQRVSPAERNYRALKRAAENGHHDFVEKFIKTYNTPKLALNKSFIAGVINNDTRMVDILLDAGADIHYENDAATLCSSLMDMPNMLEHLDKKGGVIKKEYLLEAVEKDSWGAAEYLLSVKSIDIHQDNDKALRVAAKGNGADMIELLVKHGADVHALDNNALIEACANNAKEAVKILLKHGANLHGTNDAPLRTAVARGHLDIVKILLDNGADPYAGESNSFQVAIQGKHSKISDYLKEWDANKERILAAKEAALRAEKRENAQDSVKRSLPKDWNIKDLYEISSLETTFLHMIAQSGGVGKVVKRALETGEGLSSKELIRMNEEGENVLGLLGEYKELNKIFIPDLWVGRQQDMVLAWQEVPEGYKKQVNFKSLLADVNRQTFQKQRRLRCPKI